MSFFEDLLAFFFLKGARWLVVHLLWQGNLTCSSTLLLSFPSLPPTPNPPYSRQTLCYYITTTPLRGAFFWINISGRLCFVLQCCLVDFAVGGLCGNVTGHPRHGTSIHIGRRPHRFAVNASFLRGSCRPFDPSSLSTPGCREKGEDFLLHDLSLSRKWLRTEL